MVGRVKKIATHTCTFTGCTFCRSIILSKDGAAMTDPDAHPAITCRGKCACRSSVALCGWG